jgi:hypothetical protein
MKTEQFKAEVESRLEKTNAIGTADLIFRLEEMLLRHVVFKDKRYALLIAVWILGASIFRVFAYFGYIWLNSPVKRCGKSLLLDILHELCLDVTPRLSNASVATIFRIAHGKKTMLLDEAENMNGEDKARYAEIMTLLNAGFQAGGVVPRCEKHDGEWLVTYFDAYCPKVLAGIKSVPDTIEDRSFKIPMIRKSKSEKAVYYPQAGREIQRNPKVTKRLEHDKKERSAESLRRAPRH